MKRQIKKNLGQNIIDFLRNKQQKILLKENEILKKKIEENYFRTLLILENIEKQKKQLSEEEINNVFSEYVVASTVWETQKFLFDKQEYLQDYSKIKFLPKYAIIWGNGSFYPQAEVIQYALQQNIPLLKFEDGFLRSADTWCNDKVDRKYTCGISFTITDSYYYFDATHQNRLEKLINDKNLIITDTQKQRARKCIDKIVETHLTKYNHQPIIKPKIGRDGVKKVLVVDQSYGDFSISLGWGSELTFKKMLETAIKENPDADIIVKTHPDTMTGNKGGYYTGLVAHDNIYLQTEPINPISLIKYVDKVYVCTTQFGFEALMCGKEVHTFGMPFYAGWGLTVDDLQCDRRTNTRTIEELFYIAYIIYSYYINPEKQSRCEIEEAMDYLLKLREEYRQYKKERNEN